MSPERFKEPNPNEGKERQKNPVLGDAEVREAILPLLEAKVKVLDLVVKGEGDVFHVKLDCSWFLIKVSVSLDISAADNVIGTKIIEVTPPKRQGQLEKLIKESRSKIKGKIDEYLFKKYGETGSLSISDGKLHVLFAGAAEQVKPTIEKPAIKPEEIVFPPVVETPVSSPVPDVEKAPEVPSVDYEEPVESIPDAVEVPETFLVAREPEEPLSDDVVPVIPEVAPAPDVVPESAETLLDASVPAPTEEIAAEAAQENPFAREAVLFKESFDKRGAELDEAEELVRTVRASVEAEDRLEGKEKTNALKYLDKLDGVVFYLRKLRQNQKCSNKEHMNALRAFKYLNQVGLIKLPHAENKPANEALSDEHFPQNIEEAMRIFAENEKTKIYDDPREDPAVQETLGEIRGLTNELIEDAQAKGKAGANPLSLAFASWATKQANFEKWNVFASLYPEKASAYKDKIDELPKALERMKPLKGKLAAIPEVVIPPVPVGVLKTLPPIRDAWSAAPEPVEPPAPVVVEAPLPVVPEVVLERELKITVPEPQPANIIETPEPVVVVPPEAPKRTERRERKETKESAEKPSAWRKVASIGLLVQHKKNVALSSAFGWYGKKLERELRAAQKEDQEYKGSVRLFGEQALREIETLESKSQSTLARALTGFAEGYKKSAEASEKQRQAFLNKEGVKASMAGWGALAQNSVLMTRAVAGSLGGMSRIPAILAMVANRSFDAFKEARLAKYDVINKTRIGKGREFKSIDEDAEVARAFEEASQIYEISKKMVGEGGEVTAKDLAKAYADDLPKDLIRRFERGDSEKQPSYLGKLVASVGVRGVAERLQKKFDAIEADTKLNDEQKKSARAKEIQKNESLLRDLDRMVSDAGIVDTTASVMRDFGQASKKAAAAVALETLAEAGLNLFGPDDESVMAGVEGGVSSKVPEVTPQSMVKRISEGQDIMSNENVGHIYDLKYGPVLSVTNVSSAETLLHTEPYTVKSGDNLWKLLADDLREREIFNGISAEGQRDYVIDALKDKIAAMSDSERKLLGISSGNIDKLTVGDKLDFNKLFDHEVVEGALKNAKLLSPEEIAAIESYVPPKAEMPTMDTSDLDDPMALKEFLETHQSASEIRSDLGEPTPEESPRNESWRERGPRAEEIGEPTPEESPRNEAWRERQPRVSSKVEKLLDTSNMSLPEAVSAQMDHDLTKVFGTDDDTISEWHQWRGYGTRRFLNLHVDPEHGHAAALQGYLRDIEGRSGLRPRGGIFLPNEKIQDYISRALKKILEQQRRG